MLINYNEYLKNKYYFNLIENLKDITYYFYDNIETYNLNDYEYNKIIIEKLKKLEKINNELNYIYKNEKIKEIKNLIENIKNNNYFHNDFIYFNLFDLKFIIDNEIKFNLKTINLKEYYKKIGVNENVL